MTLQVTRPAAGHRRDSEAHQPVADKLAFSNSKLYDQSVHQDHEMYDEVTVHRVESGSPQVAVGIDTGIAA